MSKGSAKEAKSGKDGAERRRSRRQPVLDTFSLFVVVPKKGIHRLPIHDVSLEGIGFDLDMEGESPSDFPVKQGETVELRIYLNQSLFLTLNTKIARLVEKNLVRRVGGEFVDRSGKSFKAFQSFMKMLEDIVDSAQIDPSRI
jgi:hypothetical protein